MGLDYYLGIEPYGALGIVITTVVIYTVLSLVIAHSARRLFASPASPDIALLLVIGAVSGRTILGPQPTLTGGLIALTTLLVLQLATVALRRAAAARGLQHRAEAIVVGGVPDRDTMGRHHLDDRALWAALRAAGVRTLDEVALVVLEQSGRVSVLRTGAPLDRTAVSGLRDAEQVYDRLAAAGLAG